MDVLRAERRAAREAPPEVLERHAQAVAALEQQASEARAELSALRATADRVSAYWPSCTTLLELLCWKVLAVLEQHVQAVATLEQQALEGRVELSALRATAGRVRSISTSFWPALCCNAGFVG